RNAVHARGPAREEAFARYRVPRDDPVQLVLGCAEMIANQFAEYGTIIIRPFQVTGAGSKHRSALAGHPGNGVAGMTSENAAGVAFVAPFARTARDEPDAGFCVVGALIGVSHRGAAEFGERDDDQVAPGRSVAVTEEVFPQPVKGPGDAPLQVGMPAG